MRDPEFFDSMAELARRLDMTPQEVMDMPIIALARVMASSGVKMGLTLVSESDMSEKPE